MDMLREDATNVTPIKQKIAAYRNLEGDENMTKNCAFLS